MFEDGKPQKITKSQLNSHDSTESGGRSLRSVPAQDRDRILAYIQSLLPHRADAEDVFQRCSIVLWRKFHDFDVQQEFLPWACGVAFYEVRNFLRVAARDRLQFNDTLIT